MELGWETSVANSEDNLCFHLKYFMFLFSDSQAILLYLYVFRYTYLRGVQQKQ